jgi:thiamine pyrophosphokinase
MRVALVIADTALPPERLWRPLLKRADLVVAADGGINRAVDAGIPVDWLVGDLDGSLPVNIERMRRGRVRRILDPYSTDLEKVMRFLERRRMDRVYIVGAIGARLDHTMGTMAVLLEWGDRLGVRVVDEHFTTTLVSRRASFRAPRGTMVSLIAPGGASGVTTTGLRYDLRDHALPFSSIGIHNEVRKSPVTVAVREGRLLLMRAHYVKPHR